MFILLFCTDPDSATQLNVKDVSSDFVSINWQPVRGMCLKHVFRISPFMFCFKTCIHLVLTVKNLNKCFTDFLNTY